MNQGNTDFTKIYGSGPIDVFLNHTWFAGPYYFTSFTNSQIVASLNEKYIEKTKDVLDPKNGNKIKRYILNFGSGNPEVFYNRFIAGQESWVSKIPESKRTDAVLNHTKQVYQTGISQINQSNYIVYTPRPYVRGSGDLITPNANVSNGAAEIIYNSGSKESQIFKAGISGLINHFALSKLNLPASGDFQLSSVPYGVFKFDNTIANLMNGSTEYYLSISKDQLMGGLPRPYSDYVNNERSIDPDFLFVGKSAEFKIPYYKYENNAYVKEDLVVSKETFINSLKAAGATSTTPVIFQYKYGEGAVPTEYQSYLNALQRAINSLGGGYIKFNLVPRAGPTPSSSDWFNKQSSSMGYSYWSPDYNAVGSWLEANSMLSSDAAPSTNTYSSVPTIIKTLIVALKDLNATYDSSTNSFKYSEPNSGKTSIFNDDPWVSKVWKGFEYSKKAVEYLNYMLTNNVFDGTEFSNLLNDPSKLEQRLVNNKYQAPTTVEQLVPWFNLFKKKTNSLTKTITTNADQYAIEMGIFAGQSDMNALWLTLTADRSFNFIPRSENGLNESILNLVNNNFKVRVSGVSALNLRDFEYLK